MKSDIKEAIDKAGIEDKKVVEKLLRIHGHDIPDSNLSGALDLLSEKFHYVEEDIDSPEFSEKEYPTTRPRARRIVDKTRLVRFVQRKARQARVARSKSRGSVKRDRFDGRIEALDDILRYLKKR